MISVVLWIGTDLTRSRVTAQEVALIRAAAEIRVAVAVAHLWLEEYVSGDTGGNLEQVWRNLDRAENLAESILDGGKTGSSGTALAPLESPALRQRARSLLNHIVELRRRARLRQEGLARGEDTGIGSASDAEFDSLFGQLSREAQALEREVERQMETDQRRMSWLLGTLLLGWTSLIVIAAAGLWSRERRRLMAEAALKHSEAQLAQSQKLEAVGRLAGGLAHDINNYVTAITSQCELVRMKAEPRVAEKMDMVIATAGKITALVRRLLAFSRQQPMDVRVIGLNEVVEGVGGMVKRLIGEDVELRTYLARDLWAVRVDPAQVEQILVNLVVNAREAMPRGGKITVETANVSLDREYLRSNPTVQPGEYVLLAVSDSGSGIPREIRDRIFEPFFTTKEGTEARGLGLSSVYGIVKQSGGHVAVYSEEGKGTTFRVYLPRTTEALTAAAAVSTAAPVGGAESVLLIEDNDELRLATRGILEVLGYRVTAAANGTEALDLFDRLKGRVDLVVCDVVMPGMSGPEAVARLRARKPDLPALFMSGYTDNVVVRHGILEGELEFLEKPYSADRLAAKVREVLGGVS
ncbi:MAG TPA: ATP-binding protein [Thermoanaerobaculia bacterium]|nr:ATP-binding protein [Thermoanaerobaculia bacterium]